MLGDQFTHQADLVCVIALSMVEEDHTVQAA
jgi:hypothetical protein